MVDPSNCSNNYARLRDGRMSHAEELARLLPASVSLVKALNSLELEDLECDRALVRDVAVAGDNPAARVLVASLVQLLYITIDTSAANRLTGEVVQSRRRPLLGPSPG